MKDGIFLIEMGKKIKAHRKALKLTYPKLSELTKISVAALWFIENGRRDVHILNLKKLADCFEVDVKDFL